MFQFQEIDECKPADWKDENIADRLQKITGTRIKKLLNDKMSEIVEILLKFKKEIDLANDIKSLCEDKHNFDMEKFKNLLRETVEAKEYENVRFEFMERWCTEVEENWERGIKKMEKKNESTRIIQRTRHNKRRYTISTDDEEEIEYKIQAIEYQDENEREKEIKKKENERRENEKAENESCMNEKAKGKMEMSHAKIVEISSEEKIEIEKDDDKEKINFILVSSSEDEEN